MRKLITVSVFEELHFYTSKPSQNGGVPMQNRTASARTKLDFNRSRKLELLQSGFPTAPFCGGLLTTRIPARDPSKADTGASGGRVSCEGLADCV